MSAEAYRASRAPWVGRLRLGRLLGTLPELHANFRLSSPQTGQPLLAVSSRDKHGEAESLS